MRRKNPYYRVGKHVVFSREKPDGGHIVKVFYSDEQLANDRVPLPVLPYKDPNAHIKKLRKNPGKNGLIITLRRGRRTKTVLAYKRSR